MTDWFYLEHFGINILRLWCYATIGLLMGWYLHKNRQNMSPWLKSLISYLKTRLAKKKEK